MRTFAAIVLGLLSAVMLFLLAGTVKGYTISSGGSVAVAFVALLAAWVISAYFIRRNAATVAAVLCRGFLIGAVEWLAMIPGTRASPEDYQNLPNSVPAILGETLIRWVEVSMATVPGWVWRRILRWAGAAVRGRLTTFSSPAMSGSKLPSRSR